MIQFVHRHRKAALALSSLIVLLLVSAIAWAVPGSDSGGWSLREYFECEDSSLYCVVWEISPGEPSGPPCCVTAQNYFNNIPTCANSNIL